MLLYPLKNNEDGSVETLKVDESGMYTGSLVPLKNGRPIPPNSQVIDTRAIKGYSPWRSGELVYDGQPSAGPPKVNSRAFQTGWDAIWGAKDIN